MTTSGKYDEPHAFGDGFKPSKTWVPLGIAYLASSLRAGGFDIELKDLHQDENLPCYIASGKYDEPMSLEADLKPSKTWVPLGIAYLPSSLRAESPQELIFKSEERKKMESLADAQKEYGAEVGNRVLVINPRKCIGCHECELACSLVHEGQCKPDLSRIFIFQTQGGGTDENVHMVCMQCSDAFCADACPNEAIVLDEKTGTYVIIDELCVGCQTCVSVCPFGGISFNHTKGRAMKCDLCGGDPECAQHCVYGAIQYLPLGESERKQQMQELLSLGKLYNAKPRS